MMGGDLVRTDPDRHGALRMTDRARPILCGEDNISIRRDAIRTSAKRPLPKRLSRTKKSRFFRPSKPNAAPNALARCFWTSKGQRAR